MMKILLLTKLKFYKNKTIKKILVAILGLSIISTTGFAIYNFGIKNISSSNSNKNNNDNQNITPTPSIISQPTFTIEQEQEMIENNHFKLNEFNNIFKTLLPNQIKKYEILTDDISQPTKIKIHYWTEDSNNYWFYSFYK